jgi:hypothetical protein
MVTVIKSGASKESIESSIKKLSNSNKKGFDANKFCGVVKLNEEPLDIQKRLRDEWK